MLYKLYRRRKVLYLSAGMIVIFMYIFFSGDASNNTLDNNKAIPRRAGEVITMQNYKIPEPCRGCPGEMGAPVYLTVIIFIYLF